LPAAEVLHDSLVEQNPAAEMSAGDELRMEKARILSMVTDDGSRSESDVELLLLLGN